VSTDSQIDPRLIEVLLQYERQAQVGRQLRGIVHNLSGAVQMARLPLDLLEIQLDSPGDKTDFALKSVQEGMNKIFEELELLSAKSSQMLDTEPRELDFISLIKEQLAFWPADLFFKHDLKHEFQTLSPIMKTRGAYCDLALAFNGILELAMEALRKNDEPEMLIKAWTQKERILLWVGDQKPSSSGSPAGLEPFGTQKKLDLAAMRRFLISQAVKPWDGQLMTPYHPSPGLILSLPLTGPAE
jgi:hypothetical protein